jgi:hypothetical protein
LADQSKLDALNAELENRLDELFSEEETPATPGRSDSRRLDPLAELKKIVLSIDWEITAEAVDGFLDQVQLLKVVYERDKIITILLQVLGSLGQYVRTSRSNVHPHTFMVLNSVFSRLEEIVTTTDMPEAAKRKLLRAEMTNYQTLRDKIMKRRATEAPPAKAAAQPVALQPAPPAAETLTPEVLARTLQELKDFIRSEFKALREQLKVPPRRE